MTDAEKIKFIEDAVLVLFKKTISLKTTDILLDLSIDSLDIVELQMYYEEKVGIETESDVPIVTVNDLMSIMK
jgi:acyl carrier protein